MWSLSFDFWFRVQCYHPYESTSLSCVIYTDIIQCWMLLLQCWLKVSHMKSFLWILVLRRHFVFMCHIHWHYSVFGAITLNQRVGSTYKILVVMWHIQWQNFFLGVITLCWQSLPSEAFRFHVPCTLALYSVEWSYIEANLRCHIWDLPSDFWFRNLNHNDAHHCHVSYTLSTLCFEYYYLKDYTHELHYELSSILICLITTTFKSWAC